MRFTTGKNPLCFLVLLLASIGMLRAEPVITVDTILQNNLRAVLGNGGTKHIRSMEKTLSIAENDYTLLALYRATDEGKMRIDVFHDDERVFSEGRDELGVWEWPGDQAAPVNVTHDGVAALEHGIEFNLFQLADLPGRGHSIDLLGMEEIRGVRYFVLLITLKDGFRTYRYVNETTWLVEMSRDFRALHPGIDATRKNTETRFDNFRRTDGILSADRSLQFEESSDEVIQTTLVLGSRYNLAQSKLDLERSYVPYGPPRVE